MEALPGFRLAFFEAAYEGNLSLLKGIVAEVENGEGPGKVSYPTLKTKEGFTALHLAASAGKTHTCEYLIRKLNFDINVRDDKGFLY